MHPASPAPDAPAQAIRLLLGMVIVTSAAAAGGLLVGRSVWAGRPEDEVDGWSDLGYGFVALVLGLLVCGLVYLIGLVLAVRWAVPRGRRLALVFAILAADALLAVALVWVAGSADRGGMPALGTAVAVALVLAAVAGLGLLMDAVRPRTAGWIGGVAGAGFLVLIVLSGLREDGVAASDRAARYEATGAPLALVDGRDLSVPVDGWERAYADQGWSGSRVTVTFDVSASGDGTAGQVRLDLDADSVPQRCEREPEVVGSCVVVGRASPADEDAAGEIMGERITGDDGVTTSAVWVDVPGGRWLIWGDDVDEADAVVVLRSLVPVDADTFAAAT